MRRREELWDREMLAKLPSLIFEAKYKVMQLFFYQNVTWLTFDSGRIKAR